jgi:NADH dehydrogenase
MQVLVTGGSGFVGREVVRQLLERGHRVRVLARGTRGGVEGVETVAGTILEPVGLRRACEGCDAVIHLVGIITELKEQTYEAVHVRGTQNLLSAATAAGVRRWIHMSAMGAGPESEARYHRSKWAAEGLVRGGGMAWTIFRPSIVYGAGDGFVNLFAGMSRWSPVLPLMGGGRMRFQPVAVEDVARCFVGALDRPETVGKVYEVGGRERFTLREILEEILAATGRRRWLMPVPWWLGELQARVLEWVFPRVLGRGSPLNRDQLRMLRRDTVGDEEPLIRDFGFEPVRFREGIRKYVGVVSTD